jgi:dihydroneopterin aldolase
MNKPLASKLTVTPETNVFANAPAGLMHVFVHDYKLMASIGIHPNEKINKQIIIVSVDLSIEDNAVSSPGDVPQQISDVVCYENITNLISDLVELKHIDLVEQLAEEIAQLCLNLPRVTLARVKVAKPDAIETAGSVGVTIERFKTF